MGELFERYFSLLAGRLPGAEYGVIAAPADEAGDATVESRPTDCRCPSE